METHGDVDLRAFLAFSRRHFRTLNDNVRWLDRFLSTQGLSNKGVFMAHTDHHAHHHGMHHPAVLGGANWVPWVGLALVLPAVIVFLVGVFSFVSSSATSGSVTASQGPGIMGIGGGLIVAIMAFGGLILGLIGLVRAFRRDTPRDGTSRGIAGGVLNVGVVVLAAIALVALMLFGR